MTQVRKLNGRGSWRTLDTDMLAGAYDSGILDVRGLRVAHLLTPENWTAASVGLMHSLDGVNFYPVTDDYEDALVALKAVAGKATAVAYNAASLTGLGWIKLRSVDAGNTANTLSQVGTKASKVLTVAEGKTLTFASGVGGPASDGLKVAITTAEDDVLAVSADGDTITVALANTTAENNTAALIEDGIQALSTVNSISVAAFTVTGNEAYDAAPVITATVAATALAGGDDVHLSVVVME